MPTWMVKRSPVQTHNLFFQTDKHGHEVSFLLAAPAQLWLHRTCFPFFGSRFILQGLDRTLLAAFVDESRLRSVPSKQ